MQKGPQPLVSLPHLSSSNGLHPLHSVPGEIPLPAIFAARQCDICSEFSAWAKMAYDKHWQTYGPCGAIALGPSLQRWGIIRGYKTLDGDMRGSFVPHHWLGDLESGSLHSVTMCDSWLQDQFIVMINSCFPCGRPTFWPAFRYV